MTEEKHGPQKKLFSVFLDKVNSEAVKAVENSAGKEVGLWVGKLNDTQNYLQFLVDGTDKGYLIFDVSRNIEQ